jgi:hypothetical protein
MAAPPLVLRHQRSVPAATRSCLENGATSPASAGAPDLPHRDPTFRRPGSVATTCCNDRLDGFSGAAWLRFPTIDFQPSERVDTTHALALDTQSLTATFSQFLATNVITPPIIADRPLPPIPRFEPNFQVERPPTQTLARIEGALDARPLITSVELKSWPSAEILSNTVVQAAVDALGFTFSATLLSSSGSTNADQHALAQAYNARFRPARAGTGATYDPARSLTWGRWIFQWHTLPLPATNVAAIAP